MQTAPDDNRGHDSQTDKPVNQDKFQNKNMEEKLNGNR